MLINCICQLPTNHNRTENLERRYDTLLSTLSTSSTCDLISSSRYCNITVTQNPTVISILNQRDSKIWIDFVINAEYLYLYKKISLSEFNLSLYFSFFFSRFPRSYQLKCDHYTVDWCSESWYGLQPVRVLSDVIVVYENWFVSVIPRVRITGQYLYIILYYYIVGIIIIVNPLRNNRSNDVGNVSI